MITVIKSGLMTTIQDLGRTGFQKYGVITSGVMDQFAFRLSNLLVGNEENSAVLEITLNGPTLIFENEALISLCGANLSPTLNNEPLPLWRPIYIKKGGTLRFGSCINGCRAYLAVAGGFDVPAIMNSKSTYLRAGIGGYQGRMLKSGDKLMIEAPGFLSSKLFKNLKKQIANHSFRAAKWFVAPNIIPYNKMNCSIRVMEGREFSLFTNESKEMFFTEKFLVTAKSDRMGYRLQGPSLLVMKPGEIVSEAVNFGTIQVPPDGNPIVLLADRQTIGGYPKIGQIATVDLPLVAQAKPCDFLLFKKITYAEAQQLYLKREHTIRILKQGILYKLHMEE